MEETILNFYRQAAQMTDLSAIEDLLTDTPQTLPELVKMIQGLVLHIFGLNAKGFSLQKNAKPK